MKQRACSTRPAEPRPEAGTSGRTVTSRPTTASLQVRRRSPSRLRARSRPASGRATSSLPRRRRQCNENRSRRRLAPCIGRAWEIAGIVTEVGVQVDEQFVAMLDRVTEEPASVASPIPACPADAGLERGDRAPLARRPACRFRREKCRRSRARRLGEAADESRQAKAAGSPVRCTCRRSTGYGRSASVQRIIAEWIGHRAVHVASSTSHGRAHSGAFGTGIVRDVSRLAAPVQLSPQRVVIAETGDAPQAKRDACSGALR